MWKEAEKAMTPENDHISQKQLLALGFLSLLSPAIRRVPRITVATAGYAAWLAPLVAFVPLVFLVLFMRSFLRTKGPGVGLAEIFLRALGKPVGRIVLALYSIWLLLYDGFLLRSGAHRFVSTVYPHAQPWVFVIVMLVLCAIAALGSLRALARSAAVFRPLLIAVFIIIFVFAFQDVDFSGFTPLYSGDVGPVLLASLPLVNIASIVVYLGFIEGHVDGPPRARPFIGWLVVIVLLTSLLCLVTAAVFGLELVTKSYNAFFIMVRDISILNTIERVESVVVALWVFTDFVLEALLLYIVTSNLRICLGMSPHPDKHPAFFDFSHGRWLVWVCVPLLLGITVLLSSNSFQLMWFSEKFYPWTNAAFVFVGLPVIYIIGKIRKTI